MVVLPACSLTMGPDSTDAARSPGHEVEVEAFWMDRCPVTVAEYAAFLNTGGQDEHYCTWMRIPEHCGKMLPTETQWERAARGEEGRIYAWGNEPIDPTYANCDFHYGGTTVVGSFPKGATPEGLFDMTGNVKEITTSLFEPCPGGEPMIYLGMREPFINESITKCQVMRDGAWTKQEACMAVAYRDAYGSLNLGFRCVRRA